MTKQRSDTEEVFEVELYTPSKKEFFKLVFEYMIKNSEDFLDEIHNQKGDCDRNVIYEMMGYQLDTKLNGTCLKNQ